MAGDGSAISDTELRATLAQADAGRSAWRRVAVLLVLATAAAGAYLLWPRAEGGARFVGATLTRGDIVVRVSATGTLQPTNKVDVGSELSGVVDTVEVDYNDRVEAGQVLARLDTDRLNAQMLQSQAALDAAKARVAEAQATVVESRQRLDRCQRLAANKMCSQEEVDTHRAASLRASAAEASARAQVAQASATLDVDRTNLGKAVIRAPIGGVVLVRSVEPGQTVAASFQAPVLFTLAEDLARMQLHVDVDEADVGRVQDGQEASFTVDAYPGRVFPARIAQVRYGAKTVGGVVSYETLLDVDNRELLLRPGMTATAEIVVSTVRDALLVPNAALRFRPPAATQAPAGSDRGIMGVLIPRPPRPQPKPREQDAGDRGQRVWVLREGVPVVVPVTIGATDGVVSEVLGGDLAAGTEVLVDVVAARAGR